LTVFEYEGQGGQNGPLCIDRADIHYRFKDILEHDGRLRYELINFDIVVHIRRQRKMLTRKYLNHVIMEYGHYLEGACSPVPEFRVEIIDRGRERVDANTPISGFWTTRSPRGLGLFRWRIFHRRPRKMINVGYVRNLVESIGGREE
jgi:hypothetical protein